MNVFISWSGQRSRSLAEALRGWLPRVIQAARPWMSDEDISAGSRWLAEIQSELSQSSLGIICVTPENQHSPWLLFEAGALSKALAQTHVCPLLLGLAPSQLAGPLSQFQSSEANRDGIGRIVSSLNKALGDYGLSAGDVDEVVSVWWPRLEQQIADALAIKHDQGKTRTLEEILEEVVANTREQLRRENLRLENSQERDRRLDELLNMFSSSFGGMQQLQDRMKALVSGAPKPEEIASLLGSPPTLDFAAMQNMIGSMKDFSEIQKALQHQLIHAPKKPEPPGSV